MKNSNTPNHRVAFLWDESFLWGLMAFKALKALHLPFELVTAKDIRNGCLDQYAMLFVPGGWASNKSKALGESGIKTIRQFVENGGNYLGFCGGAGLATQAKGGIGLLNVKRRPTKERVPSFSGRIKLNIESHPIWKQGVRTTGPGQRTPVFHAWWPSQFIVEDSGIKVLAAYGGALPDSFSSDLNVGDVDANGNWAELEKIYRINLDPGRLLNEPSVIEGTYGKGKVVLSLVHFDTPDDPAGGQVLMNLWEYLADSRVRNSACGDPVPGHAGTIHESPLQNPCAELIALGERNFLWFWRNSMLLQWRRGVRGLEYNTLYIMMKEIDEIMRSRSAEHGDEIKSAAERISGLLVPFIEKAKKLLLLERHALQKEYITYEKCDDPGIKKIRSELFADSKSYGGMFKELIDEIDSVLLHLLKRGV